MPLCAAAVVSWALVFEPAAGNFNHGCFTQQGVCEMAAMAANDAFYEAGQAPFRKAQCELQPADESYQTGSRSDSWWWK